MLPSGVNRLKGEKGIIFQSLFGVLSGGRYILSTVETKPLRNRRYKHPLKRIRKIQKGAFAATRLYKKYQGSLVYPPRKKKHRRTPASATTAQ